MSEKAQILQKYNCIHFAVLANTGVTNPPSVGLRSLRGWGLRIWEFLPQLSRGYTRVVRLYLDQRSRGIIAVPTVRMGKNISTAAEGGFEETQAPGAVLPSPQELFRLHHSL